MLTEREWRSLLQIERHLRAEDARFTRCFELFKLDGMLVRAEMPVPSEPPSLVYRGRWALSVAVLVLIVPLWAMAVIGSGDVAGLTQILACPMSALLLAVALAVHPDRRRRRTTAR